MKKGVGAPPRVVLTLVSIEDVLDEGLPDSIRGTFSTRTWKPFISMCMKLTTVEVGVCMRLCRLTIFDQSRPGLQLSIEKADPVIFTRDRTLTLMR